MISRPSSVPASRFGLRSVPPRPRSPFAGPSWRRPLAFLLATALTAAPLAAVSPAGAPAAPTAATPGSASASEGGNGLANPILFVAQVPIPGDFATIASTFGNHLTGMEQVGRGGDLYLLRPDGSLRNLTR